MPDTVVLGLPAIEFGQRSDPGKDPDKQVNEDAGGYRDTAFGHLAVVCDGMGGHAGGRDASNLALKTILEVFEHAAPRPDLPPAVRGRELLQEAIVLANRRVFQLGGEAAHARPGSTVIAVLLHGGGTEVAHVGDSRCYVVHQGQATQLTKDHSMVQKLVDAHVLTPAQAASHPEANKITRALGMKEDVEVELSPRAFPHVAGDVFILCSDGLSDLVQPRDMVQIAGAAPAQQAAGQLVDLANARGGYDNITVQVLRAKESASPGREPVSTTVTEPVPERAQNTVFEVPSSPALARMEDDPRSQPRTMPPLRGGRPSQVPPAVLAAIGLGVVGVVAAAVAIWLIAIPHSKKANAPAFATSALPSGVVPPATSLVPESMAVPDPDAAVTPSPLPSLVPSRPSRPMNGSRRGELFP